MKLVLQFFLFDDGAAFINLILAGFVFSHLRFAYLQDLKKKTRQVLKLLKTNMGLRDLLLI